MLLGILGTGLIGSSAGLAARRAGYRTLGWDPREEATAGALEVGAVERVARSPEALAAEAEAILVAAPLPETLALLRHFPPSPHARLITDVASVKSPVVAAAAELANFVAGHPLAGSERSGPLAASADLFENCTWVYVPTGDATLELRARAFIESLGARPLAVEAARHDAVVAFTSHLPQLASSSLGAMLADRAEEPLAIALSGGGMRSMTRLAGSSWEMWEGILAANAAPVAQEVRALADILRSVADALEAGDYATVGERFSRGVDGSKALQANDTVAGFVIPGTPNESEPR